MRAPAAGDFPLVTARLLLRPFEEGDRRDLVALLTDSQVMAHLCSYDSREAGAFFDNFCLKNAPVKALCVAKRDTGAFVGYLLLKQIDAPGIYELGWILKKTHWRQGFAYEAVLAVMAYTFETLSAHKLCAESDDLERSVPLMEKLGLIREGLFKAHSRQADGLYKDLYWYGLTRDDWLKAHQG